MNRRTVETLDMFGKGTLTTTLLITLCVVHTTDAIWPKDQTYISMTSSEEGKVKRSPVSEQDSTNFLPDDSSGSGEGLPNAEGSGINMLKDFMLSEKKAKGLKGDPGHKGNIGHKPKIDNIRKHDKLLEIMTNKDNSPENSPESNKLKGDTGIISSHPQSLRSSKNSSINTNSGVLDNLSRVENERKEILSNFDASQREGSGSSGNYEQAAHRKLSGTAEKEEVHKEVYEKHRKLYEELSQFFPNGNQRSIGTDELSIRPKRNRIDDSDGGDYEIYSAEQFDDEDDNEGNDEELDDSEEGLARAFAVIDSGENFEYAPRSRRNVDEAVDQGMKRKISPYPSQKYDEYAIEVASANPVEVMYDGKSAGSSYKEPTINSLQKLSAEKGSDDQMSLTDPVYERQKNEYMKKEFGSGLEATGQTENSESGSGGSGNVIGLISKSQSQENSAKEPSSKIVQKSESSSHVDAAKINMKGPKIGTDPGRPAYLEPERYNEEQHTQQQKQMHKKKKGKRKYRKEGKDIEGIKEAQEWKNDGRKKIKHVSDQGGKISHDEKVVHKMQKHGKKHKGSGVKTGEFSEQLEKIGKAKSRRKRIKLVMEKRKRKAERSLNSETWGSSKKANKMSRIGEALLTAALKQKEEDMKRSHINLGAKSVSPKKMVLESLRMPKRKGKRNIATEEENLMNIQKLQEKDIPDTPTTKIRRGVPEGNTMRIINDYVEEFSSGDNDSDESRSEDEEEAEKAQETAKILAVSTVGTTRRKSKPKAEANEEYVSDESSDEKSNEENEGGSNEITDELNSEETEDMAEPGVESNGSSESEQFIDTRSKVPTPKLAFYNGTNDFEDSSQFAKDSLGLTEIGDVKEAHVNGPSAYYAMGENPLPEDAAQSRSYIEDPDTASSDNSATEVNSLWNEARVAGDKLANIPYPTDDSQSRLKLFMNEDGVNKGEQDRRKSLGESVSTEHKKLISELMQNVNGGKTIGEKFAKAPGSTEANVGGTSDGIPVIRAMTTRKVSTSVPFNSIKEKRVKDKGEHMGKETKKEKKKSSKGRNDKGRKIHKEKDERRHELKETSQEHKERETYDKLKLRVEKQKKQPIKNRTWEAEVNTLFPGKAGEKLVVPVDDGEASVGFIKAVPTLGKPSKKHSVDKGNEIHKTSRKMQRYEMQKPTAKETRTDNVQVSTKRQCLGLSVTDCIGPDSVTFNLPLSGPGPVGVQIDNMKAPEIIYPPGAGFNYQNGFQPPNQYSPDMRQLPAVYPNLPNGNMQQQYGGLQLMNGYDNQPNKFPGAFPDHYPNNEPNMPQSSPMEGKNRPRLPTMKPSENSIFKGGARKKKKMKKQKTTTPKPKKTTTKCPNCDKTKSVESSGGKKMPLTDKLWKLKKRKRTTTLEPNTTPITTESETTTKRQPPVTYSYGGALNTPFTTNKGINQISVGPFQRPDYNPTNITNETRPDGGQAGTAQEMPPATAATPTTILMTTKTTMETTTTTPTTTMTITDESGSGSGNFGVMTTQPSPEEPTTFEQGVVATHHSNKGDSTSTYKHGRKKKVKERKMQPTAQTWPVTTPTVASTRQTTKVYSTPAIATYMPTGNPTTIPVTTRKPSLGPSTTVTPAVTTATGGTPPVPGQGVPCISPCPPAVLIPTNVMQNNPSQQQPAPVGGTPNITMVFVNCTFGKPCKKKKHRKHGKWRGAHHTRPTAANKLPIRTTMAPVVTTQPTEQAPTISTGPGATFPAIGSPFTVPRSAQDDTEEDTNGGGSEGKRPRPPNPQARPLQPQAPKKPVPPPNQVPGSLTPQPTQQGGGVPPSPPKHPSPQPERPTSPHQGRPPQNYPPPEHPKQHQTPPQPPHPPQQPSPPQQPPQQRPPQPQPPPSQGSPSQVTTTPACNKFKSCKGMSCQVCPCISCIPLITMQCQGISCATCPGTGCIPAVPMMPVVPMIPVVPLSNNNAIGTQQLENSEAVEMEQGKPPQAPQRLPAPQEPEEPQAVQGPESQAPVGPTQQTPSLSMSQTPTQWQQTPPQLEELPLPTGRVQNEEEQQPTEQEQTQQQQHHQRPPQQEENRPQQQSQSLQQQQQRPQQEQQQKPQEEQQQKPQQQQQQRPQQQQQQRPHQQQQQRPHQQHQQQRPHQQQHNNQSNEHAPSQQFVAQQPAWPYGAQNQSEANRTLAPGGQSNSQTNTSSYVGNRPNGQVHSQSNTKAHNKHRGKYPFIHKAGKRPRLHHNGGQQSAKIVTTAAPAVRVSPLQQTSQYTKQPVTTSVPDAKSYTPTPGFRYAGVNGPLTRPALGNLSIPSNGAPEENKNQGQNMSRPEQTSNTTWEPNTTASLPTERPTLPTMRHTFTRIPDFPAVLTTPQLPNGTNEEGKQEETEAPYEEGFSRPGPVPTTQPTQTMTRNRKVPALATETTHAPTGKESTSQRVAETDTAQQNRISSGSRITHPIQEKFSQSLYKSSKNQPSSHGTKETPTKPIQTSRRTHQYSSQKAQYNPTESIPTNQFRTTAKQGQVGTTGRQGTIGTTAGQAHGGTTARIQDNEEQDRYEQPAETINDEEMQNQTEVGKNRPTLSANRIGTVGRVSYPTNYQQPTGGQNKGRYTTEKQNNENELLYENNNTASVSSQPTLSVNRVNQSSTPGSTGHQPSLSANGTSTSGRQTYPSYYQYPTTGQREPTRANWYPTYKSMPEVYQEEANETQMMNEKAKNTASRYPPSSKSTGTKTTGYDEMKETTTEKTHSRNPTQKQSGERLYTGTTKKRPTAKQGTSPGQTPQQGKTTGYHQTQRVQSATQEQYHQTQNYKTTGRPTGPYKPTSENGSFGNGEMNVSTYATGPSMQPTNGISQNDNNNTRAQEGNIPDGQGATEDNEDDTTASPFKSSTPIRPKLDQAHLSPTVNDSKLADFGEKTRNTSTAPPSKEPIREPSITASTKYLPTIFPANKGGALNGTAPTIAPIHVERIRTTKRPTTNESGTPLRNYSTVFPGLAYPSDGPTNGRNNESFNATRPTGLQNQNTNAMKLPGIQPENPAYGSGNYFPWATRRPTFNTTKWPIEMLTTGKPNLKHGTQTEETVIGKQKDEFAYQTTQSIGQTNAVVPHQVFNPEKEAEEDKAAEEERQRLLAMTPPKPVTYMRDSDEDVTSPDNENKDNDWRGLQYGPLALPPAFKKLPSRKASNGKIGSKGLAEEGKQQIYGRLPTESQVPSQGYNAVPSEKLSSSEEEINPLYVNETWQKATTKRPTTSKERSTSTTGKLITTKEREPSASLKTETTESPSVKYDTKEPRKEEGREQTTSADTTTHPTTSREQTSATRKPTTSPTTSSSRVTITRGNKETQEISTKSEKYGKSTATQREETTTNEVTKTTNEVTYSPIYETASSTKSSSNKEPSGRPTSKVTSAKVQQSSAPSATKISSKEQPPPENSQNGTVLPPEKPVTTRVDTASTTTSYPVTQGRTTATQEAVLFTTPRPMVTEKERTRSTQRVASTGSPTVTTAQETTAQTTTTEENGGRTTTKPSSLMDKIYSIFNKIVGLNVHPSGKTNPTTQPSYETPTLTTEASPSEAKTTTNMGQVTTKEITMADVTTTEATTAEVKTTEATTVETKTMEATTAEVKTTEATTVEAKTTEATTVEAKTTKTEAATYRTTPTTEPSQSLAELLLNSNPFPTQKTEQSVTTSAEIVKGGTKSASTTEEPTTSPTTRYTTKQKEENENVNAITGTQSPVYTQKSTTESTEERTTTQKTEETARPSIDQQATTESVEENRWRTTTESGGKETTESKETVTPTSPTTGKKVDQVLWETTTENVENSAQTTESPTQTPPKTTTENVERIRWETTTESTEGSVKTTESPTERTTTERMQPTTAGASKEAEEEKEIDKIIANAMDMTTTVSPALTTTREPIVVTRATTTTAPYVYITQLTATTKTAEEDKTTTEKEQQLSTTVKPGTKGTTTEEAEWRVPDALTTEQSDSVKAKPSAKARKGTWGKDDEYKTTTEEIATEQPIAVYTSSNKTTTERTEEQTTERTTTRNDVYSTTEATPYTAELTATSEEIKENVTHTKLPIVTTNGEQRTTRENQPASPLSKVKTEPVNSQQSEVKVQPTTKPVQWGPKTTTKGSKTEEYPDFSARPFGFDMHLEGNEKANATNAPQKTQMQTTTPSKTYTLTQGQETTQVQAQAVTEEKTTTLSPMAATGSGIYTYMHGQKSDAVPERPSSDKDQGKEVLSKEKPYNGGESRPTAFEKEKDEYKGTATDYKTTTTTTTTTPTAGRANEAEYEVAKEQKPTKGEEPTKWQDNTWGGSVSPGNSEMAQYLLGIQKWYNKYVRKIEQENMTFYPASSVSRNDYNDLKEEIKEEKLMDKDDGYDPWRAVKEYYDVYLAEIEDWELKYGKKRKAGPQEAVNRPGASALEMTTTKEPISWRTPQAIASDHRENLSVDISDMYGRLSTEKTEATTTKSNEQNYPTNTYPKPTSKPKTTDIDKIFAQLATWKRPTEVPATPLPPNIPSKGDDGGVVYTPILPEAPTKIPEKDKGNSGSTTPDVDAIFAKIATMLQPTTKPTTAQTTKESKGNNETIFYTPKLPPAPSIGPSSGKQPTTKENNQRPSNQQPMTQPEISKTSTTKEATNQKTASVQTMYPEAESNKTTTASNIQQEETTTAAYPTTKRPLITRPTELEIVPPDSTGISINGPPKQPPEDQTSTSAPEQPITEKVDKISANQNQPIETTTLSASQTTAKTAALQTNAITARPTSEGETGETGGTNDQEQLPNPVTTYKASPSQLKTEAAQIESTTTPAAVMTNTSSTTQGDQGQLLTTSKPVETTRKPTGDTTIATTEDIQEQGVPTITATTTASLPVTNDASSSIESNDEGVIPSDAKMSKAGRQDNGGTQYTTTNRPSFETSSNIKTMASGTLATNATQTTISKATAGNPYEATTQTLETTSSPLETTTPSLERTTESPETTTQSVEKTTQFRATAVPALDTTTNAPETTTESNEKDTENAKSTAILPTKRPDIGEASTSNQQTTTNIPDNTTTTSPGIGYTTSGAIETVPRVPGTTSPVTLQGSMTTEPAKTTTSGDAIQSSNGAETGPAETTTASNSFTTTNAATTTPYVETTTAEFSEKKYTTTATTTKPTPPPTTTASESRPSEGDTTSTQKEPSTLPPSNGGNGGSNTNQPTTTPDNQGGYTQPIGNGGLITINVTMKPAQTSTEPAKSETDDVQTTERPATTAANAVETTTKEPVGDKTTTKEPGVSVEQPTEESTATTSKTTEMSAGESAANESSYYPAATKITTTAPESQGSATSTMSVADEAISTEMNMSSAITQAGISTNQAVSANAPSQIARETPYERYIRQFYEYYKSLALQATAVNMNQAYVPQQPQQQQQQKQNQQQQQQQPLNPLYPYQTNNNETDFLEGKEADEVIYQTERPPVAENQNASSTTTESIPATTETTEIKLPVKTTTRWPVNPYPYQQATTTNAPYAVTPTESNEVSEQLGNTTNELYIDGKEDDSIYYEVLNQTNWGGKESYGNDQQQGKNNTQNQSLNEEYMKGKDEEYIYEQQTNQAQPTTNAAQQPNNSQQSYPTPSINQPTTSSNEEYIKGKDEEYIYEQQTNQAQPTTNAAQQPNNSRQSYPTPSINQPTTSSNEEYIKGKDEEYIYEQQTNQAQPTTNAAQQPNNSQQSYPTPSINQPTTASNEEYMKGKDEEYIYEQQTNQAQPTSNAAQQPNNSRQSYPTPSINQPTTSSNEEYMKGKDEDIYNVETTNFTQNHQQQSNYNEQQQSYGNQQNARLQSDENPTTMGQISQNASTYGKNLGQINGNDDDREDLKAVFDVPQPTTAVQGSNNVPTTSTRPGDQGYLEEKESSLDIYGNLAGSPATTTDNVTASFNIPQGSGGTENGGTAGQQESSNGQGAGTGQSQQSQSQAVLTGTTQTVNDTDLNDDENESQPSPPPYNPQEIKTPTTKPYPITTKITNAWPQATTPTTSPTTTPPITRPTAAQVSYNSNGDTYMEGKENEQILYQTTTQPQLYQQAGQTTTTSPVNYGNTYGTNKDQNNQETGEKESSTYDYEAVNEKPTTKPTTSATTAKAGVSIEIPSSQLDTDTANDGNGSTSVDKIYNPNQYQPTTQKRPEQTTATEAGQNGQPGTTATNEKAAATDSEFTLPSATNYASKGAYPWYPTTRVDVRKTTISRQAEKAQQPQNTAAVKESEAVGSSDANINDKARENDNSISGNPGSQNGVMYSNGYPYNDTKTYQEYLRNFYADSKSQYQPTGTSAKTASQEERDSQPVQETDTITRLPSQTYTASIKTDTKAQTRTNAVTSQEIKTVQGVQTSAATAGQGEEADAKDADESRQRNEQFQNDLSGRPVNMGPSVKSIGNEPNTQSFGSGQESINGQSNAVPSERQPGGYETTIQVSFAKPATERSETVTPARLQGMTQEERDSQVGQYERTGESADYGIQRYIADNDLQSEAIGKGQNENLGMYQNEKSDGSSISKSTLAQQNYASTTTLSSTDASIPTKSMYNELPSKNMFAQVPSKSIYVEETSNMHGNEVSSSPAQRRGEAVKVAEEQQPKNNQSHDEQAIAATATDLSKEQLPTPGQEVSTSQIYTPSSGQQSFIQQTEQRATVGNETSNQSTAEETNNSTQLTATTTASSMNTATVTPTTATTIGTTKIPSASAGTPTSKVIAEMKTTDRSNTSSNVEIINPVTGSVILTERVSYADLNNETDEGEQDLKSQSDASPKGPSIFFTTNSRYLNGVDNLGAQRSAVGAERVNENAPASLDKDSIENSDEKSSSYRGGQSSDDRRYEGQGSGVQSSEADKATVQSSDTQSIVGDPSGYIQEQKQSSSATETSDEGAERAIGDYSQEVNFENPSPSLRVQIPNNEAMPNVVNIEPQERPSMDSGVAKLLDTSDGEKTEGNEEQDNGNEKIRVIRTLPATQVPPLTSPLVDNKTDGGHTITTNAQPTKKVATEAQITTTKSVSNTPSVTGDMMVLNDKLGLEQVESGDYLGSPPEVAAQHIFTPRTPEQPTKNGSANYTLHKIFSEIVGDVLLGNDAEGKTTSDDAKQKEYGDQDAEDSKEDIADDKTEESRIQNDGNKEKANQSVESSRDNQQGRTDLTTQDAGNQKVDDSSEQQSEFSEKPSSMENDKTTDMVPQKVTVIEQRTEPASQSSSQSSESTDQSLKTLDQGSVSSENLSQQPEKESTPSTGPSDGSTNTPTVQSTKPWDQSATTETNTISTSLDYKKLTPLKDEEENASQRDEIDENEYKEPNIVDDDDEFELPRLNTESINESLEDLLLHPDSLPPDTVAEDITDEGESLIEAGDMVVHDDLDR